MPASIIWPSGDPIQGAIPLSSGTTVSQQGRAVRFTASGTGTVVVTFFNLQQDTLTLALGDNIYPYSIQSFATGTATVTNAASLI